jgi:chromosome segregation ATPase
MTVQLRFPAPARCGLACALTLGLALTGCGDDGSAQRRALELELADSNAEADSLRAARRVLETRLEAARTTARIAGERVRQLEAELSASRASVDALSARVRAGTQMHARLRADHQRLRRELAGASRALQAGEAQRAALARELSALRGWLDQSAAQALSQDNALKTLEGELARKENDREALDERIDVMRRELDRSKDAVARHKAASAELRGTVESLNKRIDDSRKDAEGRVAQLDRARAALATELEQTRAQARDLDASNEQLKSRLSEIRDELARANEQAERVQNTRDELADALGARDREVEELKSSVQVRATEQADAVAALDAQRMELETRIAHAQESLRAALAENLAREQREQEARARMAALRGELDRADERGERMKRARDYLGDKLAARDREAGELKRSLSQRRSEHADAVGALNAQRDELAVQVRGLQESLRLSLGETQAREQRAEAIRQQVSELRGELSRTGERVERLARTRAYLDDKLRERAAEAEELKRALAARAKERAEAVTALGAQREELDLQVRGLQESLRLSLDETQAREQRAEAIRQQVSELRGELSRTGERAERLARTRAYLDDKLRERAGEAEELKRALAAGAKERAETVTALGAQRRELQNDVRRLRESLRVALAETRTRERREQAIQAQLDAATVRGGELETRVGIFEDTLAYLTREKLRREAAMDELARNVDELRGIADACASDRQEYVKRMRDLILRNEAQAREIESLRSRTCESNPPRAGTDTLQGELDAARAAAERCAAQRERDAARLRDLRSGNELLHGEVTALGKRLRELQASVDDCQLRRTAR